MSRRHLGARNPAALSACRTSFSITSPMCWTSSRVPWNALLAVTVPITSQIGCRPRSAAASGALHHQRRGAHPHDHAVPPAVEGNRGFLDDVVGRGGAAGQEAGAEPFDQVVRSDVVGRDDDHAAAAAGADPVLRDATRPAWCSRRRR